MTIPHVDIATGKIKGCKKYSQMWWHEKGHLEYDTKYGHYKIYQEWTLKFWMLTTTLSIVNKYMLFLAIPLALLYTGWDIYEEWWCNRYSKANFV